MSKTTAWIILVVIILILLIGGYFLFFQENEEESTNTNATVNGNVNAIINVNSSTKQPGSPVTYTNKLLEFTIVNPDQLYITEFSNDLEQLDSSQSVALACMNNYPPDMELHPQPGELVICFNALPSNRMDITEWYEWYSTLDISNHEIYESVTHENVSINELSAIKEKIINGESPLGRDGTEWIDGERLNYYFLMGSHVVQIESIVHNADSELLKIVEDIANSFEKNK